MAELVSALEKMSRNLEIRHQQSAEFVNDLKRQTGRYLSLQMVNLAGKLIIYDTICTQIGINRI